MLFQTEHGIAQNLCILGALLVFPSEGKAVSTEVFANWRYILKEPSGAASASASAKHISCEKCI